MSVRYTQFYDEFQNLLDTINHDSDHSQRLSNLQQLYKDGTKTMLRARDEAAYDLRTRYSSQDAEALAGISSKYINYWANRYRIRYGLAPLKRRNRIDLSNVIDLSER